MPFSLGQSHLKLPENSAYGATFPLEKPQRVPNTDDLALSQRSISVHTGPSPECERKENEPQAAGLGVTGGETTRRLAEKGRRTAHRDCQLRETECLQRP